MTTLISATAVLVVTSYSISFRAATKRSDEPVNHQFFNGVPIALQPTKVEEIHYPAIVEQASACAELQLLLLQTSRSLRKSAQLPAQAAKSMNQPPPTHTRAKIPTLL